MRPIGSCFFAAVRRGASGPAHDRPDKNGARPVLPKAGKSRGLDPIFTSRPVSRVLSAPPVSLARYRQDATAIHLGRPLPGASCNQPGWRAWKRASPRVSPRRMPPLFGLAPGGVCRAAPVARSAVRSYRTVSPLPRSAEAARGGLISVALSLGSPPAAVSRHPVSMEPGLSSTGLHFWATGARAPAAAVRPAGALNKGMAAGAVKGLPATPGAGPKWRRIHPARPGSIVNNRG